MPAFARLWLLAEVSRPDIVLIFLPPYVEASSEKVNAISLKLVPISLSAR